MSHLHVISLVATPPSHWQYPEPVLTSCLHEASPSECRGPSGLQSDVECQPTHPRPAILDCRITAIFSRMSAVVRMCSPGAGTSSARSAGEEDGSDVFAEPAACFSACADDGSVACAATSAATLTSPPPPPDLICVAASAAAAERSIPCRACDTRVDSAASPPLPSGARSSCDEGRGARVRGAVPSGAASGAFTEADRCVFGLGVTDPSSERSGFMTKLGLLVSTRPAVGAVTGTGTSAASAASAPS